MSEKPYFSIMKVTFRYRFSGHKACVYALSGAAGPYDFFSGGGDAIVAGWRRDQPQKGHLIARTSGQIFSLAAAPTQPLLWAGTMQGMLYWLPLDGREKARHVQAHRGGIFAILPFGKHLLTGGEDGCLCIWDVHSGCLERALQLASKSIRSIDYAPDRNELAIGASDHHIYLLDTTDFSLRHRIEKAHDNSVFTVRYHPDASCLWSGGRDAHLKRWQLDEGQPCCRQDLPAHMYTINAIAPHPSGRYLATGSRDKSIRIWDSERLALLKGLARVRDDGHAHSVNAIRWLDDTHLVSASDDRTLILWEITDD